MVSSVVMIRPARASPATRAATFTGTPNRSPVVLATHSPELLRDPAQGHKATARVRVRLLIAEELVERRAVAHIDEYHRTVAVGGRHRIAGESSRASMTERGRVPPGRRSWF